MSFQTISSITYTNNFSCLAKFFDQLASENCWNIKPYISYILNAVAITDSLSCATLRSYLCSNLTGEQGVDSL